MYSRSICKLFVSVIILKIIFSVNNRTILITRNSTYMQKVYKGENLNTMESIWGSDLFLLHSVI